MYAEELDTVSFRIAPQESETKRQFWRRPSQYIHRGCRYDMFECGSIAWRPSVPMPGNGVTMDSGDRPNVMPVKYNG